MSESAPTGGKILTIPFIVLAVLAIAAAVVVVIRLFFGLDAVTNLNNGYPWGIWIVYDLVVGTAFACGGYALALVIYVGNRWEYHSLIRPAILTSLFGYTLGMISAVLDMGRWWQAYNLMLPQHINTGSVFFEVAMCVGLYCLVLIVESSPPFLERIKARDKLRLVNKLMFLVIALGIVLPTMHQSSIGTMLIALGTKLSPLWQTDLLPILFLWSAVTMGFSIVIFEGSISAMTFRRPLEKAPLMGLYKIICWMLGIYLAIRFGDVIFRGALGYAFAGDLRANMFWVENLLFLAPLLILASSSGRRSPRLLFLGAVSMLLAGAVYRFNAYLVGYNAPAGHVYFPSVPELLFSVGIIAIEILLFLLLVKTLPILHRSPARA
jgi:Ni/Fe-hydrogenase subunit HybB-like protein